MQSRSSNTSILWPNFLHRSAFRIHHHLDNLDHEVAQIEGALAIRQNARNSSDITSNSPYFLRYPCHTHSLVRLPHFLPILTIPFSNILSLPGAIFPLPMKFVKIQSHCVYHAAVEQRLNYDDDIPPPPALAFVSLSSLQWPGM